MVKGKMKAIKMRTLLLMMVLEVMMLLFMTEERTKIVAIAKK